jgi:hypothetical protein
MALLGAGGPGRLGLAAVVAVAVVAAGFAVHQGGAASPPSAGAASGYACGFAVGVNDPVPEDDSCGRRADDRRRRAAPDPAMDPGSDRVKEVRAVITEALSCPGRSYCVTPDAPHGPGLADATAAIEALRAHRYTDPVVRIAAADDPAPAGALLYAVRIDRACVVGFLQQAPDGAGSLGVSGLLPDGTCLSPG